MSLVNPPQIVAMGFLAKNIDTGIHLTGKMNGWATPKDLILHLAGKLTVRVGLFSL
jgi:homoaconitase/3-isopropylmalate dehydratase large subunit